MIQGIGQSIWGTDAKGLNIGIPDDPIIIADIYISTFDLTFGVVAAILVAGLILFFQKTRTGRALRAVADDHEAALSVGIPLLKAWAVTWVIAGIVATVAGVAWGSRLGVRFSLWLIALKALPVLILGGIDSIPGAILAGLVVGAGENLAEVLSYLKKAGQELEVLDNLDADIERQREKTDTLEVEALEAAEKLSAARRRTAAEMERAMTRELESLAFEQSGVEVRFRPVEILSENLRPTGFDRLEFFFAPNPGEPPRPLAQVASGGELSRLMLAFKCLLARKDMVETVIFDEVDAGVGGEAAESVARKIKELANHHQVICITHLPQIAARGSSHFRVAKKLRDGRTITSVSRLKEDERVEELARMLAGEAATNQTEAWARELLDKGKRAA